MKTLYRRLTLALLLTVQAISSRAQEKTVELGHLSSFRSMGIVLDITDSRSGIRDQVKIYADMMARWSDESNGRGFGLAYSHLMDYRSVVLKECTLSFYAGPGVDLGFKADLGRKRGPVIAVSGEWGMHFDFSGPVSVRLGFSPLLGVHFRGSGIRDTSLSLYKYGLATALLPEFSVIYRL